MESLEPKCFKDYVNKKEIENRINITLQSLETYRYISSKTKSY